MQHLGDITKIGGYTAPIVDCLIGGSPCQDLSVAGLRKGMQHSDLGDEETTRSGLFMEQIRIAKEMRENDKRNRRANEPIRPRFMVWENVLGAKSSNREDFRVVLEEVARISEAGVTVPRPEKGKWSNSGCILGDGWSIAWRVFDAQYWGVPQRRRRICLLADFDGYTAAEVLFSKVEHIGSTEQGNREPSLGNLGDKSRSQVQPISEGLSGNTQSSQQEGKETPSDATGSIGTGYPAFTLQDREGKPGGGKGALIQEDRATLLRTNNYMTVFQPIVLESNQNHATITQNGVCPTLPASMGLGGGYVPMITSPTYSVDMGGGKSACDIHQDKAPTLCTTHYGEPAVCYRKQTHPRNAEEGQGWEETDKSDTLNVFDNSENRTPTLVVYDARGNGDGKTAPTITGGHQSSITDYTGIVVMDRAAYNQGQNAKYDMQVDTKGVAFTETSRGPGAVAYTVALEGNGQRPSHKGDGYAVTDKSYTLNTTEVHGVCYWDGSQVAGTLTANNADGSQRMPDKENFNCVIEKAAGLDCYNMTTTGDKTQTITCSATDANHVPCVIEHKPLGLSMQSSAGFGAILEDKMTTLIIGDNPGWQNGVCHEVPSKVRYIVRRLTPMECERLQGFPDGWTDIGEWIDAKGKVHKPADSNRYKALGNSIALPSWRWVLKRLCGNYERPATMASLFDGIGGFPLIWESINGKGSCLWASEIEEFPIAVTERRINGRD